MSTIFAYGTLCLPEVLQIVTDSQLPACEPGILKGFRRFSIEGKVFPGITPAPAHSVSGVLYYAVSARALKRIDYFEDSFYERRTVEVCSVSGPKVSAFAYVVPLERTDIIGERPWDLDEFRRDHNSTYLANARHWMKAYTG
ncbi:MAG: gamma-glutamylcyclotransferase [Bdellovibrionales bacterium]|nr:gamma-glutamylcyclotransferase [Bdellovibrionales bacterium]